MIAAAGGQRPESVLRPRAIPASAAPVAGAAIIVALGYVPVADAAAAIVRSGTSCSSSPD